jgi:hypothetical protein
MVTYLRVDVRGCGCSVRVRKRVRVVIYNSHLFIRNGNV